MYTILFFHNFVSNIHIFSFYFIILVFTKKHKKHIHQNNYEFKKKNIIFLLRINLKYTQVLTYFYSFYKIINQNNYFQFKRSENTIKLITFLLI